MVNPLILDSRLRNRSEQQAATEANRFQGPPTGMVPQVPLVIPGDLPVAQVSPGAPQAVIPEAPMTTGGPVVQQGQPDPRDPRKRNGTVGVSIGGTQGGVGIRL